LGELEAGGLACSRPSRALTSLERRRRRGLALGAICGGVALTALLSPWALHFRTPGAMNPGHETLACEACHVPAPGNVRQQIQANFRFLLGQRHTPADFGALPVSSRDCLACHERPLDRHPIERFLEPRFKSARQAIAPERCVSCHREHSGARITRKNGYCAECHDGLTLEHDPLEVSHAELVANKRWNECLGCHDFHGNHVGEPPTRAADAISNEAIESYFGSGKSPYPPALHAPARKERARDEG